MGAMKVKDGVNLVTIQFPEEFSAGDLKDTEAESWTVDYGPVGSELKIVRKDKKDILLGPGDWLMRLNDGSLFTVSDAIYKQLFEEVVSG